MTVQKIFVYKVKCGKLPLVLHGPDNASPSKLLSLYIDWFNNDYALENCLPKIKVEDFEFLTSYCPLDFYDEYIQECK